MVTMGFYYFPFPVSEFTQALSGLIWFPELDGSHFLFCLVVGLVFSGLPFYWFIELNSLTEGIERYPEGN